MGRRRQQAIRIKQGMAAAGSLALAELATPPTACEYCGGDMAGGVYGGTLCDDCFQEALPRWAEEGLAAYEAYCAREGAEP